MSDEKEKEQPKPEAPPEKKPDGGQPVQPFDANPGGQPGGGH